MNNIIIVNNIKHSTLYVTEKRYQYDYGQALVLTGMELPDTYEVSFSNQNNTGEAKTVLNEDDRVPIPDEYFLSDEDIYFWVFMHTGEDDGRTVYKGRIPIAKRTQPTDEEPTPVEQSEIKQAIASLQAAVAKSELNVAHYPKIEEGTWYVYDAEGDTWVDTGVQAKGDKGDTGQDGHSPVVTASKVGKVTTIYVDGTAIATINDGEDSGGGGTSNYANLTNKPSINNVVLNGNNTTTSLGLFSGDYDDLSNKPTIPTTASDVGAIASPLSPSTGAFLVWDGSAWVAQTLSAWEGGNY